MCPQWFTWEYVNDQVSLPHSFSLLPRVLVGPWFLEALWHWENSMDCVGMWQGMQWEGVRTGLLQGALPATQDVMSHREWQLLPGGQIL